MNKVQEQIERLRIVGAYCGTSNRCTPMNPCAICVEKHEAADTMESMQARQELLEKVLEAIESIKEIRPYQAKRKLEQALAPLKEQT